MSPHPGAEPDAAKADSSAPGGALVQTEEDGAQSALTMGFESDLSELSAKFAAHAAGNFSPELSAELALEIVLNEIVEGACLAMGATGAAIVLERDGEMRCRASNGITAPELGSPLDPETGISGECVRTHQLQRCDDAQSDPRADIEASRRLGVRSVMAMPLLRGAEVLGVFEVFSTRAAAFGERDERTLDALAQRVLTNLQRAAEPVPSPAQATKTAELAPDAPSASAVSLSPSTDLPAPADEGSPGSRFEPVTWVLGLTVLACAVILGALLGWHFGWSTRARTHPPTATSQGALGAQGGASGVSKPPLTSTTGSPSASASPTSATGGTGEKNPTPARPRSPGRGAATSVPPEGALLIYENGKEVFRLPSSPGQAELPANGPGFEAAGGSSDQPKHAVELTPTAAEDSLLYRVEPGYPEEARQQQIQGAVVLDVHIGPEGGVQEVTVVSGNPLLAQAATDAVKQWRFKPHQVEGHAVEMQTRITLNFRLPQ